ncbi:hypothetical protein DFS33DRAFT_276433 [Desarmillaria ectypa]|nr:hypothetical protein DFS33DRAFT_276433 [Desarmillaria ectypa]
MKYSRPCNQFVESELFAINPVELTSTSITSKPSFPSTESDTASSVSGIIPVSPTASNVPPRPASHTGAIVGSVLGLLALGCMVSAYIYVVIRRGKNTMLTGASSRCPVPSTLTLFPLNLVVGRMQGCERRSQRWRNGSGAWKLDTGVCLHHHTGLPQVPPLARFLLSFDT